MFDLTSLMDELKRNDAAMAAMTVLEAALGRRTPEEQGAFWHAVGLYYVSRKHPGDAGNSTAGERAITAAGV
ncbi:hypothetical protein [Methylobacterium soli]|uniref:Uncharacterized protein n=1 Tax=Methylobacterium soli TaxID=553447 RepID=A0A6L3SV24_9HYPH|nr:hypothetical protein [Methylobacterium soli]KAB1077093.1 hypothetical protein F6X53_20700 [Methylobacterium soli]GJE45008.1 hypothetical protein AEGHOMDF_4202 [Methylobacterium soli]